MAEIGRRDVVGDPLALNPNAQAPDRSLALSGVRNPGQTGGNAATKDAMDAMDALSNLSAAVGRSVDRKKDEWITEGRLAYFAGKTEAEMKAMGNSYSMQGWQSLNAVDAANRWYADEMVSMQNGGKTMDPEEYNRLLVERRSQFFNALPEDPVVRKMYADAFDELGPRLSVAQTQSHNEWNQTMLESSLGSALYSSSYTNSDASQVMPGGSPLAISPSVVRPTVSYTDRDVDLLTRTMLGEAAGEGATGLAAVAHVIVNRAIDGGYGGSGIESVVLAPKQFSAWNTGAGGNNPSKWDVNSQAYQNARQIALTVLGGHNVDPTGGATHYYSPRGMDALVAEGSQSNRVPSWLAAESAKSNGTVQIGGHIFAGRANMPSLAPVSASTNAAAVEAVTGFGVVAKVENGYEYAADGSLIGHDADGNMLPGYVMPNKRALVTGAELPGIGPTGGPALNTTPPTAPGDPVISTQAQNMIRNSPLPPERKAVVVAQQILTQFEEGNTQLYNDLGGVAFLQELGADPQVVRQVISAHDAYIKEQNNKFNLERIQSEQTIVQQVTAGTKPIEDALGEIDAMYRAGSITDERAKSLASAAMSADFQNSQEPNLANDVQRELADTFRSLKDGTFDAGDAADRVREIGLAYNLPESQINTWIGKMWQQEEQDYNSAVTAAEQAEAQRIKDQAIADQVKMAIASGTGLGRVTDTMGKGPDAISGVQYGIDLIKERAYTSARDAIPLYQESGLTPQEAQAKALAEANKQIHQVLNQQGVVDTKMQDAYTAASVGVITNQDGSVRDSTLQAFDAYLQMVNDPNVGSAYASQYFKNEDGRDFMTLAAQLYGGDFDLERALLGAQQILKDNQGLDVADLQMARGTFDTAFQQTIQGKFSEFIGGDMFNGSSITEGDAAYARNNTTEFANIAYAEALSLKAQRWWVPDAVIAAEAAENTMQNTFLVAGSFVYGKGATGERLDQVMGLTGYDKDTPNEAIQQYVERYAQEQADAWKANGSATDAGNGWGRAWAEREPDYGQYGISRMGNRGLDFNPQGDSLDKPPIKVVYDAASGKMYAYLWADDTRTTTLDIPPIQIDVAEAGAEWLERNKQAPGPVDDTLNFFKGLFGPQPTKETAPVTDQTVQVP